ncbi:MAG: molybdopterin-dependent oxidoreductase [Bacillota bacterium]|nr:molybdopterin-dependent oxidoreductase [Bacillota bacterium]
MVNQVNFIINEQTISFVGDMKKNLLSFLRDELQLTGTKCGCSTGDCGACTVIIDGEVAKSCLVRLEKLNGKKIETIENLSQNGKLHPLQRAFIECDAIQCGFCTPGMIMAAKALLDKNPNPTEIEIKNALHNNLCRCTGYKSIIEAIQYAAKELKGETHLALNYLNSDDFIGKSYQDKDGFEKVTGKLKFGSDYYFENMLYGALILSDYPHARLVEVNTSEAIGKEGVVAVLTAEDIPGRNRFGRMEPNQPVMVSIGERVKYIGDVIAVVFAVSEKVAKDARKFVKVKYEELPGVFDPISAMESNAPQIHEKGNILSQKSLQIGNIENGFSNADIVVEESYFTPFIEHAYLEPEAGVALLDDSGNLTIYYGSQVPFASRKQVAASLGLSEEKIRIAGLPLGGAFGGKADVLLEIILGLGALKTGRPVKITLTRDESIRMSVKRHAFYMRYKTGVTSDGKLTALQGKCILDAGAYAGMSSAIGEMALYFGAGPYVWPNLKIEIATVYTNNIPGGPFRGFGINQVTFAVESQMDIMARKIVKNPLDFRLINALGIGTKTITGEVLKEGVGIKETLLQVKDFLSRYKLPASSFGKKIGVGIASGYKNVGYGRGYFERVGASIALKKRGRLELCVSVVDMGQGTRTVLAQMASGITKINYDLFDVVTGDTAFIAEGVAAIGQRQTYLGGNAVIGASNKFVKLITDAVGKLFKENPKDIGIKENMVFSKVSGKSISLKEIFEKFNENIMVDYLYVLPATQPLESDLEPSYKKYYDKYIEDEIPVEEANYRNWAAYAYLTQAAVVEVDITSGEVRLLAIIGAHDVGKAINPQKVKHQIEGSFIMGMGYGLSEELILNHGKVSNSRLKRLGVPYIKLLPEMVSIIVEDPVSDGPFGAKGASEVAMVPTAAAITNAIADAVGIRITQLPATTDKVLQEIRKKIQF